MSLFQEVDKDIKQIKEKEKEDLQNLINSSEMYRPSNGSEGDWFHRNFCENCSKDNEEKEIFCETIGALLGGDSEDVRIKDDYVFCLKDSNFNLKDFILHYIKSML